MCMAREQIWGQGICSGIKEGLVMGYRGQGMGV